MQVYLKFAPLFHFVLYSRVYCSLLLIAGTTENKYMHINRLRFNQKVK